MKLIVWGITMTNDSGYITATVDYSKLKDEDLVEFAKNDNSLALDLLLSKYKNLARSKARTYFLVGADKEDIVQEGMIGLYKAIRDYDINKLASFRSFAEICINRQIITAIKAATRQKHVPLNSYISLNKNIYGEDSDRTLIDIIEGNRATDPMELFIGRENVENIESKIISALSELEIQVLTLYLEGRTYQEIALELKRTVKSIDNALQRIKRKLERHFTTR